MWRVRWGNDSGSAVMASVFDSKEAAEQRGQQWISNMKHVDPDSGNYWYEVFGVSVTGREAAEEIRQLDERNRL